MVSLRKVESSTGYRQNMAKEEPRSAEVMKLIVPGAHKWLARGLVKFNTAFAYHSCSNCLQDSRNHVGSINEPPVCIDTIDRVPCATTPHPKDITIHI